jgi:hypothetical protein
MTGSLSRLFGHENGMFKLGTALAIRGNRGPIIVPRFITGSTQVDHGFNGKNMPRLHGPLGLVFGIVRNIGDGMKQRPNAVAAVGSYDAAFLSLGGAFNDRAQIAVQRTGLDQRHGGRQAVKGRLDQASTILIDITDQKCFVQISVIASCIICCHIQIDNIFLHRHERESNGTRRV